MNKAHGDERRNYLLQEKHILKIFKVVYVP